MQEHDRGSKWLIQHHGDAILRLIGVREITAWKTLQAEAVHWGSATGGRAEGQAGDRQVLYLDGAHQPLRS